MRAVLLWLCASAFLLRADDIPVNAPSAADVDAKIPAKPPIYHSETPLDSKDEENRSSEEDEATSPDGIYLAATRTQPDPVMIWKSNLDTEIFVVADVSTDSDEDYVRYDISRMRSQLAWSPNSQYVVMTTVSAGGHSPWHFNAYAYSVKDKTLRKMDEIVGPVVSPAFKFVGPHTVEMKIDPPNGDLQHPKIVDVDLDQKFAAMPKEKDRKDGSTVDVDLDRKLRAMPK